MSTESPGPSTVRGRFILPWFLGDLVGIDVVPVMNEAYGRVGLLVHADGVRAGVGRGYGHGQFRALLQGHGLAFGGQGARHALFGIGEHGLGAGAVEGGQPARLEHADELGDVPDAHMGPDVLEHVGAVDHVEAAVAEQGEIVGFVEPVYAAHAVFVELLGLGEHGRGDVHPRRRS